MKNLISFIILLTVISCVHDRNVKDLSHQKRHKIAKVLIEKASFFNAIEHLEALVKDQPQNKIYLEDLALSYFKARNYAKAEGLYEKAVKMDGKKNTANKFRLAQTKKSLGKYKEAFDLFDQFSKAKYTEKKGERLKVIAKSELESCNYALRINKDSSDFVVRNMGDLINCAYADFAPRLKNDTVLIYSSLQQDSVITVKNGQLHIYHVKEYVTRVNNSDNKWTTPTPLPIEINTIYESNANGVYSLDKSSLYFSRCILGKNSEMMCDIYKSTILRNGVFQEPKRLGDLINKRGYNSTQPMIAKIKIGKKEENVLIYSTNRPGGRGGMDLWFSVITADGHHKTPINMGKIINTPGDEISPFWDTKNDNFYFSSNFHKGFGGFDVFRTNGTLNKWSEPMNIGKPINSEADDTYFILMSDAKGFFTSNRKGSIPLRNVNSDDIYEFVYKPAALLDSLNAIKRDSLIAASKVVKLDTASKVVSVKHDTVPENAIAIVKLDTSKTFNLNSDTILANTTIKKVDTGVFKTDTIVSNSNYSKDLKQDSLQIIENKSNLIINSKVQNRNSSKPKYIKYPAKYAEVIDVIKIVDLIKVNNE